MAGDKEEKSKLQKFLETAKIIIEIIAIFIAGWWAYTRFTEGEAPSLVSRVEVKGELSWYDDSKETCQGDYQVEFKNIGKTPIEITKAIINVWYVNVTDEMIQNKDITYLDPLQLPPTPLLVNEATDRFNGTYGPDESSTNGFTFIVKKSLRKRVLFKIELWRKTNTGDEEAFWTDWRWWWACDITPNVFEKERKTNSRTKTATKKISYYLRLIPGTPKTQNAIIKVITLP